MNWLGFSLSPQDQDERLQQQQQQQLHHECFDDDLANPTASLNHHHLLLPTSNFGMLQPPAFTHHIHSRDGNMNAGMNSSNSNSYKMASSSDQLSTMMMGNTSATSNNSSCIIMSQHHHQQQPKLENFLGQRSFEEHDHSTSSITSRRDYMFDMNNNNVTNYPNSNNNLGLSMIKTWLRNQPPQKEKATKQPTSSLSLSMSTPTAAINGGEASCSSDKNTRLQCAGVIAATTTKTTTTTTVVDAQTQISSDGGAVEAVPMRKAVDTFGQRTSIYRGVTRHRWTGRYEAHLWDNSCRREGQTRKGRQVYLGGYDKEDKAARSYDLAALKYWGTTTTTNFPISCYEKEIEEMKPMTRQEYVASLRRKSSGFSRGASIYRGVTRHHQHGRWQARIGRVAGNKDLYLGTFSTQEEAAEAYDIAAIKFRGLNAVTNFDMSRYDVKSILESSALPITAAKRLKEQQQQPQLADHHGGLPITTMLSNMYGSSYGAHQQGGYSWPALAAFNQPQQAPYSPLYGNADAQGVWCKQEQDQQLHQLGEGTHNFFHDRNKNLQQAGCGGVMGLMDCTEHSSAGSNSVMYGAAAGDGNNGMMAMSRINDEQHQAGNININNGFGGDLGGSSNRNSYYHQLPLLPDEDDQHESSSSVALVTSTSPSSTTKCNMLMSWVPTVAHPTFTVWNDA